MIFRYKLFLMISCLAFWLILFSCRSPKNDKKGVDSSGSFHWKIESVSGQKNLSDTDLKGKIAVLHFFASWCPPCLQEFPEFIKWTKANYGIEDLVIIPISLDRKKTIAESFFRKNGANVECFFDKGETADTFDIQGIPATVILDPDGKIRFKREGSIDWANGEADKIIKDIRTK